MIIQNQSKNHKQTYRNKELNWNQVWCWVITWEVEVRGSSVQSQPHLHMEFQVILIYIWNLLLFQNTTKNNAVELNVVGHACNPNTQTRLRQNSNAMNSRPWVWFSTVQKLSEVAHSYNLSTWEVKTIKSLKPSLATQWVWGQPEIHHILSKKAKTNNPEIVKRYLFLVHRRGLFYDRRGK